MRSDVGIYIDHLSLFVIGSGDIFISDVTVLRKSIESRIEVLCCRKKVATAGMIQFRFQPLPDLLCLEHLDDLFSLDDVPVRSINTETVYRLIAVVVSEVKRPQQSIMVHTFLGRFDTSGTAVGTMKNAGYPKYQPVELSAKSN